MDEENASNAKSPLIYDEGKSSARTDSHQDSERERRCCGPVSVALWNILACGLSFLLLFSSYNSAQMLQAPTQKTKWLASVGVGLVFASYSITSIFAPNIVHWSGERRSLIVGGCFTTSYMAVNLLLSKFPIPSIAVYAVVYWLVSILNGVGSSLLWTSQGSLITLMAKPETLGTYNGIFGAMYMMNFLSGGFLTQFLLGCNDATSSGLSQLTYLYIVFSAMAGSGVLLFLFIRRTSSIVSSKKPIDFSPMKTLRILADRRIRFLYPCVAVSGFGSAFFLVILTGYSGSCMIGYLQVCLGVAEVCGSLISGRVSDKIGRTPVFLAGCGSLVGAAILASFTQANVRTWSEAIFLFPAFFLYGLGDSTFASQSGAVLGHYFPEKAAHAFAAYHVSLAMMGGIISSIGFLFLKLPGRWKVLTPAVIMWVLIVCAACSWKYLDSKVQSMKVEEKQQIVSVNEVEDELKSAERL